MRRTWQRREQWPRRLLAGPATTPIARSEFWRRVRGETIPAVEPRPETTRRNANHRRPVDNCQPTTRNQSSRGRSALQPGCLANHRELGRTTGIPASVSAMVRWAPGQSHLPVPTTASYTPDPGRWLLIATPSAEVTQPGGARFVDRPAHDPTDDRVEDDACCQGPIRHHPPLRTAPVVRATACFGRQGRDTTRSRRTGTDRASCLGRCRTVSPDGG